MSWTIHGLDDKGHEFEFPVQSERIIDEMQQWLSRPLSGHRLIEESSQQFRDPDTKESVHLHRNWTFHVIPNR